MLIFKDLGVYFVIFFLKNKTCILQFYFLVMPISKKIMGPLLAFFCLKILIGMAEQVCR